jgi:hypothetical protein
MSLGKLLQRNGLIALSRLFKAPWSSEPHHKGTMRPVVQRKPAPFSRTSGPLRLLQQNVGYNRPAFTGVVSFHYL